MVDVMIAAGDIPTADDLVDAAELAAETGDFMETLCKLLEAPARGSDIREALRFVEAAGPDLGAHSDAVVAVLRRTVTELEA